MSIIEMAEKYVKDAEAHQVDVIELQIGTEAGIEFDALDFCWPVAIKNTVLGKANRVIEKVQAVAKCPECDTEFEVTERYAPCPICQNLLVQIIKGKELRIVSLMVS